MELRRGMQHYQAAEHKHGVNVDVALKTESLSALQDNHVMINVEGTKELT